MLKTPKEVNSLDSNIINGKKKFSFMTYGGFQCILVPEDNGKQNLEESYASKYRKHVACSYSYKLVCVGDIVSKSFNSYLCKRCCLQFY